MILHKNFFKLYQTIEGQVILLGIVFMQPPSNSLEVLEFVEDLEDLIEEGVSFSPTTLDVYLEFNTYKILGDITQFNDSITQNISC